MVRPLIRRNVGRRPSEDGSITIDYPPENSTTDSFTSTTIHDKNGGIYSTDPIGSRRNNKLPAPPPPPATNKKKQQQQQQAYNEEDTPTIMEESISGSFRFHDTQKPPQQPQTSAAQEAISLGTGGFYEADSSSNVSSNDDLSSGSQSPRIVRRKVRVSLENNDGGDREGDTKDDTTKDSYSFFSTIFGTGSWLSLSVDQGSTTAPQHHPTTSEHSDCESSSNPFDEKDDSMDASAQTLKSGNVDQHRPRMPTELTPSRRDMSFRTSSQRILQELRTKPDEKDWDSPVSCSNPWTVLRKVRLMAGRIVDHPKVQLTIIALIVINAVMLGIATFDFVSEHERTAAAFDKVDTALLILFTVELGLQICYRGISLFLDGWLVFDFVIIVASWTLTGTQVIRAFRIFRAVRLVTRIGPLRDLIAAIGAVMPRMYAITMLLLLIFYIYGVLFTQLFGDLVLSENYFGSLDRSLFTCMELMTMEWAQISREVMLQKSWAWLPFLSYIAITGFIVFNLIIAVVCDAVAVIDRAAKAEKDGPFESDANKLLEAKERIHELTVQVASMKEQHEQMCEAMGLLTKELQHSLAIMEEYRQKQGRPE